MRQYPFAIFLRKLYLYRILITYLITTPLLFVTIEVGATDIDFNKTVVLQPNTQAVSLDYAFSPKQGATELIIKAIENSKVSIKVAAYSFTARPIADALIKAQQRGVKVMVVVDHKQTKDKHSMFKHLSKNAIQVRSNDKYSIMHNKFMIIDDAALQLGSFNYTSSAEKRNAENVLIINGAPQVVAAYTQEWQKLWTESE